MLWVISGFKVFLSALTCPQATHDEAIQIRTNLRLQTEEEEQRQNIEEFKLKREKERTKLSESRGGGVADDHMIL